jgi:glucose/arabinose dehydrogenase
MPPFFRVANRTRSSVLVAGLVVAACSAGEAAAPTSSPAPEVEPTLRPNRCVVPLRTPGLARLVPWLDGRPFVMPVELVAAPGSSKVYVAEMTGKIYRVDPGTADVRLAADLAGPTMNEGGLRTLAMHPTKPRAFVGVERPPTESEPIDSSVALEAEVRAYDVNPDGSFDMASESIVLRVHIPKGSHGMDTLRFGPDGMLYVSVGDGRTSNDFSPPRFDGTKLRGAILRIDVDAGAPYAVPPDNPFVVDPAMRSEIFAYGFRNPWRFSFDRSTGDLFVGDVGENRTEEIDRVTAGSNYGWPFLEGFDCTPNSPGCSAAGVTLPAFSYTHAVGNAVTGGYVYRGAKIPALAGKYVYADFQAGGLFAVDLAASEKKAIHLNAGEARPQAASLGEGADGELFVLDWLHGGIYSLVADTEEPERPPFAEKLSQTGCFEPDRPLVPTAALTPYDVNVQLWSDGAGKQRFISLPDGAAMQAQPDGHVTLPPGGLTIKTFFDGDRPIETRFMGRQGDGEWVAATYVWRPDGSDAELVDGALDVPLRSGRTWTIPGAAQCFFCHQPASGMSLGLDTRQLDRPGVGDAAGENQLARFVRSGILQGPLPALPPLATVDGPAPLETRMRSYLHTNCSSCHRPGVAIFGPLDLRAETPFEQTGLCAQCGDACTYVTPGSPADSLVSRRMHARGAAVAGADFLDTQMPPVATNVVDTAGAALIDEWITTTTRCAR